MSAPRCTVHRILSVSVGWSVAAPTLRATDRTLTTQTTSIGDVIVFRRRASTFFFHYLAPTFCLFCFFVFINTFHAGEISLSASALWSADRTRRAAPAPTRKKHRARFYTFPHTVVSRLTTITRPSGVWFSCMHARNDDRQTNRTKRKHAVFVGK